MKKIIYLFLVFSYFLGIAGCSKVSQTQSNENKSTAQIATSYPSINFPTQEANQIPPGYPPSPKQLSKEELNSIIVPDPVLPDPSKGSLSGVLINGLQNTLMGATDIYLSKALGAENNELPPVLFGAIIDQGDIQGKTLDSGVFIFNNIPPGNYFLIVSMDLSPVVATMEENIPILIVVEEEQINNLGVVYYSAK
jgi:hypothetical protein